MAAQYNEPHGTANRRLFRRAGPGAGPARHRVVPVSGYTLMKRAGEAALRYLRARWPMALRIVIVCGGGNNGGDGYVLARFAQAAGLEVSVIAGRAGRGRSRAMRARRMRTSRPAAARCSP